MNRRNFLSLAGLIPAFAVLMPRASRIEGPIARLRITLLNPEAQDIAGATTVATREDFRLLPNGPWDWGEYYVNCRDIKFPYPEYDWGDIHGFRVSDMSGKQVCIIRLEMYQYARKGNPCTFLSGHFALHLPE